MDNSNLLVNCFEDWTIWIIVSQILFFALLMFFCFWYRPLMDKVYNPEGGGKSNPTGVMAISGALQLILTLTAMFSTFPYFEKVQVTQDYVEYEQSNFLGLYHVHEKKSIDSIKFEYETHKSSYDADLIIDGNKFCYINFDVDYEQGKKILSLNGYDLSDRVVECNEFWLPRLFWGVFVSGIIFIFTGFRYMKRRGIFEELERLKAAESKK